MLDSQSQGAVLIVFGDRGRCRSRVGCSGKASDGRQLYQPKVGHRLGCTVVPRAFFLSRLEMRTCF